LTFEEVFDSIFKRAEKTERSLNLENDTEQSENARKKDSDSES